MINEPQNAIYDTHEPNLPKTPKFPDTLKRQLKQALSFAKKPKVITIFILVFTVFIVALALSVMSKGQNQDIANTPTIVPKAVQPSPQNGSELSKQVQNFNNELDNIQNFPSKLKYPIVDLDISFEK